MTPMEKHQSQVAARVLEELKKRSMEGYYCRTAQEAARKPVRSAHRAAGTA